MYGMVNYFSVIVGIKRTHYQISLSRLGTPVRPGLVIRGGGDPVEPGDILGGTVCIHS